MHMVYSDERQFDTVEDLHEALTYEWENLRLEEIRGLVSSMPTRVWELYQRQGASKKY